MRRLPSIAGSFLLLAAAFAGTPRPPIQAVATGVAAMVGAAPAGPLDAPVRVAGLADFERRFPGPASALGDAVRLFFANGGQEAWVLRRGPRGLAALDTVANLDLLCLPGASEPAALREAAAYAERRRLLLLLDPPPGVRIEDLPGRIAGGAVPRSSFAALYAPEISIAEAGRAGTRSAGPCGAVAGVLARLDRSHGVWKSPAGSEAVLNGVAGLALTLAPGQLDALGAQGVNALRRLPSGGVACWGARTLESGTAPEYRYVAVRRLASLVERSLRAGTGWAAAQADDAALWQELRLQAEDFLRGLWRSGAFQGATPAQAFFVRCGPDTTSAADVALGRVNLLVGFAPVRPAEFLVVRIALQAAAPASRGGVVRRR